MLQCYNVTKLQFTVADGRNPHEYAAMIRDWRHSVNYVQKIAQIGGKSFGSFRKSSYLCTRIRNKDKNINP